MCFCYQSVTLKLTVFMMISPLFHRNDSPLFCAVLCQVPTSSRRCCRCRASCSEAVVKAAMIPHIFVWGSCFWFCIPPPPSASASLRLLPPVCSHTTCSHTPCPHQLVLTQLAHTHTLSSPTCSHQFVHTQLAAHTHLVLTNLSSHNLLTHNLSSHILSSHILSSHILSSLAPTQLVLTQLVHTQLVMENNALVRRSSA